MNHIYNQITDASILAIFFPLTQIKPLVTGAKFLGDWGVLSSEAMVLKGSFCQARMISYSKVIVNGDSLWLSSESMTNAHSLSLTYLHINH